MRARLAIEAGEGTPAVYDLAPGPPVTLGRHRDNTIVLHDEHASRRHAAIVFTDGQWRIECIGAINGTRLDGVRIGATTVLQHGQEVCIGDTRLRFTMEARPAPLPDLPDTALLPDELTALCRFMASAVEETEVAALLGRALETLLTQTRGTFAGFLSLDPEQPLPRLTAPVGALVDLPLSRQLTRLVQERGRPVWLAADQEHLCRSESLVPFTDALCVSLRTAGTPLGALHVYQAHGLFLERHLRFAEALGGYLASCLLALRMRRNLEADNLRLRGHAPASDQMLGSSASMERLRQMIARAAARPATVLIRGETGVGKELVALALHRQGPRRDGPLVVVNCAAIAATLPEAELFGHCKGAFTGAHRDRPGLFQQADDGTLFLDEVGELPLDCQAKLLRVIERKVFRPVGATAEVRVDVRIVAATNRDLEAEVRKGSFREDLYYRLQVLPIAVPPLREHPEDIPELTAYYIECLAIECHRPLRLTDAARQRLQAYSWPGNVRQLWAVLESAVTMSDRSTLDAVDLPLPAEAATGGTPSLRLDDLESWAIQQALRQTKGNVTQAARLLGVVRDTLTAKMKRKGIDRENPGA